MKEFIILEGPNGGLAVFHDGAAIANLSDWVPIRVREVVPGNITISREEFIEACRDCKTLREAEEKLFGALPHIKVKD